MKTTLPMAIHFMVSYYKSLATMYMKEFENLILNCFFKVEYCHFIYKYTIICVQYLSELSTICLCKVYIFGSMHAMKTTILPLDSVKQNLIPNDTVLVKCPQIYIIKLFMTFVFFEGSSGIIFTYHFRNIRTRMLNTIYRVLFSGLCV